MLACRTSDLATLLGGAGFVHYYLLPCTIHAAREGSKGGAALGGYETTDACAEIPNGTHSGSNRRSSERGLKRRGEPPAKRPPCGGVPESVLLIHFELDPAVRPFGIAPA